MKKNTIGYLNLLTLLLIIGMGHFQVNAQNKNEKIRVSLQKRVPSNLELGAFIIENEIQEWNSRETALIICDMWDQHWCSEATERVAEMAPHLNTVVSEARKKGALIVHAPSDAIDFYKDHPARKLGQKYKYNSVAKIISENKLDSEENEDWPFEISNGGCMVNPNNKEVNQSVWTRQIETIDIHEGDAISDSGTEIGSLFRKKKNQECNSFRSTYQYVCYW